MKTHTHTHAHHRENHLSPLERHHGDSGTTTSNPSSRFDLHIKRRKKRLPVQSADHSAFHKCGPELRTQALRVTATSINSHLPLCEPGPSHPRRGWETLRVVERSFTPLRWCHESKLPIKKQLQAAAGAGSCSHSSKMPMHQAMHPLLSGLSNAV